MPINASFAPFRQNRPAVALLISQLAMTAALVALVASPWYSQCFNQMLKESEMMRRTMAHEEPRNDTGANPVRAQLNAAEELLRSGDLQAAKQALQDARTSLINQSSGLDYDPPRLHVEKLLRLTAELTRAQGETEAAAKLDVLRESLRDPEKAKSWYAANRLPGYEQSYPVEYQIHYYLNKKDGDIAAHLAKALTLAESSAITTATRNAVLWNVATNSFHHQQKPVLASCLKFWMSHLKTAPVETPQQAQVLLILRTPALEQRDGAAITALQSGLETAISKELLPKATCQSVIDDFQRDLTFGKLWPPTTSAQTKALLDQISRLEKLCRAHHLDDTALRIARAGAECQAPYLVAARARIIGLLATPEKWCNNKSFQFNLANTLVGFANESRRVTQSSQDALYALTSALKVPCWNTGPKVILLNRTGFEYDGLRKDKEADKLFAEAWRLADTVSPGAPDFDYVGIDFSRLLRLFQQRNYSEAAQFYAKLQSKYKENPAAKTSIANQFLSFTRAYAMLDPQMPATGFPLTTYNDAVAYTEKQFGEQSDEHRLALLYLAQYYYTRGQKEQAIATCRAALAGKTCSTFAGYAAAADLLFELTGTREYDTADYTHAKSMNLLEADCQISIYRQLQKHDAGDRLTATKRKIREQ